MKQGSKELHIIFAIMSLLAWYAHRTNISRLLSGTESKIGKKG